MCLNKEHTHETGHTPWIWHTPETRQTKGKLVQWCLIASNNRTIKTTFYSFFSPQTHSISFSSHHKKTSSNYSCRSLSLHCMKQTLSQNQLIHIYTEACKEGYCKYLQCKSIKHSITEQQGVPLTLQFYSLFLWW